MIILFMLVYVCILEPATTLCYRYKSTISQCSIFHDTGNSIFAS